MNITVVGTGYVGLVAGACFAEMGNSVTCVDTNVARIDELRAARVPFHEPGLLELVASNVQKRRLRFEISAAPATHECNLYFIAVGTPPNEDGSADVRHVLEAARELGQQMRHDSIVVTKSTVPVGTTEKVQAVIDQQVLRRGAAIRCVAVSNPEFLREGNAVNDFMRPDRIIVGTDSDEARDAMRRLYLPFMRKTEQLLFMNARAAELTKYVANALLATKISFMNEIANVCERIGVDVEQVRHGIGSDERIGHSFLRAGCGYGGSCFPKDVKALIRTAQDAGIEPEILCAVESRNRSQKRRLFEKITTRFGRNLQGHRFGVWGLSFKPDTDDMREAPSLTLLHEMLDAGAQVHAFDPAAMGTARRMLPDKWLVDRRLCLCEHQYAAVKGADALVLVTEWKLFCYPDFQVMKETMKRHVIFDGRNQFEPAHVRGLGFEYFGIGRGSPL